jgi:phosphoribosylformimino-5-aminoimidazole carboxamide ribotide isomerase
VNIIPVIDLQDGTVVRAHAGQRHLYKPIDTPLTQGSDPVDVAAGLLAIHSFSHLYIADLNAILGKGENLQQVARLRRAFPAVTLWVDNGIADAAAAQGFLAQRLGFLVLGSESQIDTGLLLALSQHPRIVLSLDFLGETFRGPAEILARPALWPNTIIVMTLACIGGDAGPDLNRLAAIVAKAEGRHVYAAGGVRNREDLLALKHGGIAGALVASALHSGALTSADLKTV